MKVVGTKRGMLFASLVGVGMLASIALMGGSGTSVTGIQWAQAAPAQEFTPAERQAREFANTLSNAFRAASERVLPSVVTLQVTSEMPMTSTGKTPDRDEMFRGLPEEFQSNPLFKKFFEDMPQGQGQGHLRAPKSPQMRGMGSGVIVDKSGIILTNNHVVGSGGKVVVRLHDGREFEATDVKTDPKTDIAVVRIEGAGDLPVAAVGNSDNLEIGDWVLAVGAPFGLRETVTAGIISAKSRGIGISEREDYLQTDAAINPGNSGGPLVNLHGEVVGINTAISTSSGGYDGVGFAVPFNLAKWVSDQLITTGKVERAFLGVAIQPMTEDLAKQMGTNERRGALVTEIRPNTPAANSKLKTGDVIVDFDGKQIDSPSQLQAAVERATVGQQHKLSVVRGGDRMSLDVSLDKMPETLLASGTAAVEPPKSEFSNLGLEVSDLDKDVAEQLGMQNVEGVLITAVEAGSPAEEAGLIPSSVIMQVGKKKVKSVEDFRSAVKTMKLSDGILMHVRTGEGSRFLVVK